MQTETVACTMSHKMDTGSVDPDQTLHKAMSDQDLRCLH